MSDKLKILVITEIEPAPTTASGIILYRHFSDLDAELLVLKGDSAYFRRPRWISAILNRIARVFPNLVDRFVECYEPRMLAWRTANRLKNQEFDVLLTLAHARMGLHAWRIGRRLNLPVITFFHDWWPELFAQHSRGNTKTISTVSRDFDNCQLNSDLSLAVCPGMKRHLKKCKQAEVLYPIPDKAIQPHQKKPREGGNITVVYTGSLWHPYGAMLERLVEETADDPGIVFKIHGDEKYLPESTRTAWKQRNILHGFVSGDTYLDLITKDADILLAVMGEDSEGSIRMQTSFPSKVANYFCTGNPVVLWAPESSSLGEFCQEYQYKLWVSSREPADVKQLMQTLRKDFQGLGRTAEESINLGASVFSQSKIQNEFIQILESVSSPRKRRVHGNSV